jgi:NADH dehydrogenase/NADH:ubiquinone oxidoreductase subunit G
VVFLNSGSDVLAHALNKSTKDVSVYIGHHKDLGHYLANIVLPSLSFFEKEAKFLNFFNQIVTSVTLINGPLYAKNDVDLLRMLTAICVKFNILTSSSIVTGLSDVKSKRYF